MARSYEMVGIELETVRVDASTAPSQLPTAAAPDTEERVEAAPLGRTFTLGDFLGQNKLFMGGMVVCGPRGGQLHWSIILVATPGILWLSFIAADLARLVCTNSLGFTG